MCAVQCGKIERGGEEGVWDGRDDNVDQTEAESVISMPDFDGSLGSPTRLNVSLNLDRSRILSALVCINIVWRRGNPVARMARFTHKSYVVFLPDVVEQGICSQSASRESQASSVVRCCS